MQRLLDDAKRLHRKNMDKANHKIFILSGVVRCGECGRALIGQSAHGKIQIHRYYAHASNRTLEPIKCSVKRYNANEVEKILLAHLATDAQEAGYLDDVTSAILKNGQSASSEVKREIQRVEKAIKAVDVEIENVFLLQSENPFSANVKGVIAERLEKLSAKKKSHSDYLADLILKKGDLLETEEITSSLDSKLSEFKKAIHKAEPVTLKRLIRGMYDVLFLKEGRLEGFYVTANRDGDSIQSSKNKKASGVFPEAFPSNLKNHLFPKWHPSGPTLAYWLEWWRRRESNPRPKNIYLTIYEYSPCFVLSWGTSNGKISSAAVY